MMKKLLKCFLKLAALGAAIGGAFAYLKKKGYIQVTTGNDDEDLDDFSCPDSECTERTYIHVDTEAIKEKAEEIAEEIKEKAEDAYDEAKKMAGNAAAIVAHAVEKVWYKAEAQVEKVEEFFNDEED